MPQVMVLTPLEPFPHLNNDLMIPSFAKCEVGNFFYLSFKLGPGNHSIEFSYVPVGLKMRTYISSFALIFIVLLFFKQTKIRQ